MPIPNTITRNNVLKAIKRINVDNVPPRRNYRHHAVLFNNRRYPCKLLISWAYEVAANEEYPSKKFVTNEAQNYLTHLGFNVIHF